MSEVVEKTTSKRKRNGSETLDRNESTRKRSRNETAPIAIVSSDRISKRKRITTGNIGSDERSAKKSRHTLTSVIQEPLPNGDGIESDSQRNVLDFAEGTQIGTMQEGIAIGATRIEDFVFEDSVNEILMGEAPVNVAPIIEIPPAVVSMNNINATIEPASPRLKTLLNLPNETNLIDIPFSQFGEFVGLANPIKEIPPHFTKAIRNVFIDIMEKAIDGEGNNLYFKKFFLLPIILFSQSATREMSLSKEFKHRLDHLRKGDWSKFTVGKFRKKQNTPLNNGNVESEESKIKRRNFNIVKDVKSGNISRAMRTLTNDMVVSNLTEESKGKILVDKHPVRVQQIDGFMNEEDQKLIREFMPNADNKIRVSRENIIALDCLTRKERRPGVSTLRFEHIYTLLGIGMSSVSVDAVRFGNLYAKIIELMVNGLLGEEVYTYLRDIELFALNKGVDDIRPLGFNCVHRKIASAVGVKVALLYAQDVPEKVNFRFKQFAFERAGCEKIIHSLRAHAEIHPEHDFFCMDGVNAYQHASIDVILLNCAKYYPQIFPFVKAMYGNARKGFMFSQETGKVMALDIDGGVTQGDVFALFLYCIGTIELVHNVHELIHDNGGAIKVYADDVNIAAPFQVMCESIQYILDLGPQYGYNLSRTKGSYMLGKCDSSEEAYRRKQHIVSTYRLLPELVHVHPDNCDNTVDTTNDLVVKYGARILGGYIGSDAFVEEQLENKIGKLQEIARRIGSFPDTQIAMVLLKRSFNFKINHILRTTYCKHVVNLTFNFENAKQVAVEAILGTRVSKDKMSQVTLPLDKGGFGLQSTTILAESAYVASIVACSEYFDPTTSIALKSFTTDGDCECPKFISAFVEAFRSLQRMNVHTNVELEEDRTFLSHNVMDKKLQSKLTEVANNNFGQQFIDDFTSNASNSSADIAWLEGISSAEGSSWIDTIPYKPSLEMTSEQFRAALRYRLRLDQPTIIPGSYCQCASRNNRHPLDLYGLHLSTHCTKHGFVAATHDNIKYCLDGICREAGRRTKIEEKHCFAAQYPLDNKRPDITVFNNVLSQRPLIIDTTITAPIPQPTTVRQLSKQEALIPLRSANKTSIEKKDKYLNIADENGLDFLAFVMESTGKIHYDGLNFLEKLSHSAQNFWNVPQKTILKYWVKLLSITLQRSLMKSIISRSYIINGILQQLSPNLNDLRNASL